MIDADLETQLTAIRSGVSINRNRRVAEDHRLYFTETSLPNAGFEFSGDVTIGSKITDDQIELLSAGLKYIHAIGSGKSRGLGWLQIEQEERIPATQEVESIETDSETFTELSIKVTLESPIITGGRKPSGQAAETVQYIRGGLIRGAVANALLADLENSEPDDDFKQLFLNDGAGIFRNCYPGVSVLPATAIGCKDFSGFLAADKIDLKITASLTRYFNDLSQRRQACFITPIARTAMMMMMGALRQKADFIRNPKVATSKRYSTHDCSHALLSIANVKSPQTDYYITSMP